MKCIKNRNINGNFFGACALKSYFSFAHSLKLK